MNGPTDGMQTGSCFSYCDKDINKDNPPLFSGSAILWHWTESAVVCFLIKKKIQ